MTDSIQEQIDALKQNQPLLAAFIKDVIRESISIHVETDTHYEGDRHYVTVSASVSIDDVTVASEQSSTRL